MVGITEGVPLGTFSSLGSLVGIMEATAGEDLWMQRAEERDVLPDPTHALVLAGALFLLGFLSAWRRARTVEVAG